MRAWLKNTSKTIKGSAAVGSVEEKDSRQSGGQDFTRETTWQAVTFLIVVLGFGGEECLVMFSFCSLV